MILTWYHTIQTCVCHIMSAKMDIFYICLSVFIIVLFDCVCVPFSLSSYMWLHIEAANDKHAMSANKLFSSKTIMSSYITRRWKQVNNISWLGFWCRKLKRKTLIINCLNMNVTCYVSLIISLKEEPFEMVCGHPEGEISATC